MENLIHISMLNDFIFCPYSIYLHNVYMETDENMYHAVPQIMGKMVLLLMKRKLQQEKEILSDYLYVVIF